MKTCSCGATYSMAEWLKLKLVNVLEDVELRDCSACGSCLVMRTPTVEVNAPVPLARFHCPLRDFAAVNDELPALASVLALNVGEEFCGGGGAAAEWTVRRIT